MRRRMSCSLRKAGRGRGERGEEGKSGERGRRLGGRGSGEGTPHHFSQQALLQPDDSWMHGALAPPTPVNMRQKFSSFLTTTLNAAVTQCSSSINRWGGEEGRERGWLSAGPGTWADGSFAAVSGQPARCTPPLRHPSSISPRVNEAIWSLLAAARHAAVPLGRPSPCKRRHLGGMSEHANFEAPSAALPVAPSPFLAWQLCQPHYALAVQN
eukprot:351163-Chlamydomonas_euryale.AAC.4